MFPEKNNFVEWFNTWSVFWLLPNLANDLEPIQKLTRKGEELNWSAECETAIQIVKKKINTATILKFYDPKEKLILQVDSRKDGIGAVLMQNNLPLEYASRALTASKK